MVSADRVCCGDDVTGQSYVSDTAKFCCGQQYVDILTTHCCTDHHGRTQVYSDITQINPFTADPAKALHFAILV